jgi:iron complex transport system ATP-binding protein
MLEIRDTQIGYGQKVVAAFDGVYAFAKAKFITIIGPNGSGKSTLINALTTGQNLLSGSINLNEKSIISYRSEIAEQLAVVRTQRDFSRQLTIREMLEFSQSQQSDLNNLQSVLADFDLTDLASRRLGSLSDGQLQRALIARAIVQNTPLLIMDEPTNHLDIHHRTDILVKLKSYTRENDKIIIFSSHEIDLSLQLADIIISIHEGNIRIQDKQEFLQSHLLSEMFPSKHLNFKNGKIDFNALA